MTKLTLINCAEENIEQHTNKERVHRHLPTKMIKKQWLYIFHFQPCQMMTIQNTWIHTQEEGGLAPQHLKLAPEKKPFSYRTQPCWKGQSAECIADFPIRKHLESRGSLLMMCAPALHRRLRPVRSPGPCCVISFLCKNRKKGIYICILFTSSFVSLKVSNHTCSFSLISYILSFL